MVDQAKRQELLDKAYKLGFEYEKVYRGCSQCTIAAVQDVLGLRDDMVFKVSNGFAGGGGLTGIGYCGGYLGGVLVMGQLCGRERNDFKDAEGIRLKAYTNARNFAGKFIKELGSVICRDIQTSLLGRHYYIADPDEMAKFEKAGGHDNKCTDVVGRASRLTVEFILDQGLIQYK